MDGNDVLAVYKAVLPAVERARAGGGPSLVENVTYRWRGHSKSDANRYRSREEIESWKSRDPIARLQDTLITGGLLTEPEAETYRQEANDVVDAAVAFAEGCPEPDLQSIEEGVYA